MIEENHKVKQCSEVAAGGIDQMFKFTEKNQSSPPNFFKFGGNLKRLTCMKMYGVLVFIFFFLMGVISLLIRVLL